MILSWYIFALSLNYFNQSKYNDIGIETLHIIGVGSPSLRLKKAAALIRKFMKLH